MNSARTSHARVKLALIPVLALTLVYVLMSSRSPGDTSPPETVLVTPPAGLSPAITSSDSTVDADTAESQVAASIIELRPHADWPVMPLDDVLANNPFAWPAELAPPVLQSAAADLSTRGASDEDRRQLDRQNLLDQLAKTGVSAYYVSKQGVVALVGSRVLHIGDVIDGQLRVRSIEPDQVTYDPLTP